ncbi:hypothetical protein [Rhodospirillum centenum]|uniref:hypothetical protein n=1 Tax=Rhodospirillum centenum TaxID=34018 RepID=UPI001609E397|nr:hypothetical protein [Rhodospirillum centenum]
MDKEKIAKISNIMRGASAGLFLGPILSFLGLGHTPIYGLATILIFGVWFLEKKES